MSVLFYLLAQAAGSPPVTAAMSVPDLAADTRKLGDPRKFFVFHQEGVTLDQARRDFATCARYWRTGPGVLTPFFHPFDDSGESINAVPDGLGQYGLTGAVIGAIIAGPLDRSKRQINSMRCMLPRGYARYNVSEELWKELNDADLARSIELQARIASGPVPKTPRVLP